jgi:hypothetical protein
MGKIASNLPNDSQPWGRDIEARIEKLEALVASNEINNAARDQRAETNLAKVSDLLSNTAALKTYQTEILGTARSYDLYNNGEATAETSDLTFTFSIDKPRIVSLQYSVNFDVWATYTSSATLHQEWSIDSAILINGNSVSTSQDMTYENYTTSNPLADKWVTATHLNTDNIPLEPGDYVVSVSLKYKQVSGAAATTFFFQGDVLTVSIIE